jgi:hypothetical protein
VVIGSFVVEAIHVNYEALTAWGTLSAVFVALFASIFPLWRELRARQERADTLRRTIYMNLYSITVSLEAFLKSEIAKKGEDYKVPSADSGMFAELKACYPQALILQKKHFEALHPIYFYLSILTPGAVMRAEIVEGIVKDCRKALDVLGTFQEILYPTKKSPSQ